MKHIELQERVLHAYLAMGLASNILDEVAETDDPEVVDFRQSLSNFLHWSKRLVEKQDTKPSISLVE
ncbi:hypothetical protein [uncultured Porticoccus sp.]|jgi:hypothetical protein|uniref:hypothetical protein n=1 Tax=uncultured Porticoccus sp. TaxID=1256050 RepID=UPI0030DADD4D|tara:strand:- start:422 stop:622 length:201 start_codon:yes stop_codon:yes gene_type:complete